MNPYFITAIIFLALIGIGYYVYKIQKHKRRQHLFQQPFPSKYKLIIEQNMPIYAVLPSALQQELLGHIQVFLDEKAFYGFDGIEISDEIRVTVAAHACLLLLRRKTDYFPGFKSIYIYPSAYIAHAKKYDGMLQSQEKQIRHGESWFRGPLVLAWNASQHGAMDIKDGHNVILHEFAHKLDEEDGKIDGAPSLPTRSRYISWARAMYPEFKKLQSRAQRNKPSVMDHYGATEPAEFFAVLVETFFEKPRQLNKKHPELYAQMRNYFNLNPINWY